MLSQGPKKVETRFACQGAMLKGDCKKVPCTHTFDCNSANLNAGQPSLTNIRQPTRSRGKKSLKIAKMTAKIGTDGTGKFVFKFEC